MLKQKFTTTISALSVILLLSGPSTTLAQESKLEDVNNYLCKDIMRMTSGDREISVGFLHGWWMAKLNLTKFDKAKIGKVTENFVEFCLDNPKVGAIDAMGRFVSAPSKK